MKRPFLCVASLTTFDDANLVNYKINVDPLSSAARTVNPIPADRLYTQSSQSVCYPDSLTMDCFIKRGFYFVVYNSHIN